MEIDELSIVVKGDISDVQEKLDKLSGMMKNLGNSLKIGGNSSSTQSMTRMFDSVTTSLTKTSKKTDSIAKDIASSIINQFHIASEKAQREIFQISSAIEKESSKNGIANDSSWQKLAEIIQENGVVIKEEVTEQKRYLKEFYDTLKEFGDINVEGFDLKNRFEANSVLPVHLLKKGGRDITQSNAMTELNNRLGGALFSEDDLANKENMLNRIIELVKEYRQQVEYTQRPSEDETWSALSAEIETVYNKTKEYNDYLNEFKNVYKDLGKDWKFTGSVQSAQIYLKNFTQQLENAKVALRGLELDDNVGSKAWKNQIKNISVLENKIEILKGITAEVNNNLQDMSNVPIQLYDPYNGEEVEDELDTREKIVNVVKEETKEIQKRNAEVKKTFLGIDFKKLFPYNPKELLGEISAKIQDRKISSGKLVETEEYRELGKEIDLVSAKIDKLKSKMKDKLSINPKYAKSDTYKGWEQQLAKLESEKRGKQDLQDQIELEGRRYEKASRSADMYTNALKNVSKQSYKAKSGVNSIDKTLKNFMKSITRVTKMLRLMVTRMILRGLIRNATDGFKNLIQWSDKVNASFSLIWNSFRQSGNAMSAMIAPLLVQLAPAIDKIIQLFIKATNVVNQFFSALTGNGTWIRAKKLTDSYRDSINGASKATQKSLASFDKLNVLTSNNGGGSGSETTFDNMFEEAVIDDKIKSFSDKIKSMFDDLKNSDFGKNVSDIFSSVFDFGSDIKESSLKWLSELDFSPLSNAFTTLSEALKPFVDLILNGLSFAYNEVLLPIGSWFMEDLAPTGIETVSKAIDLLVAILNDFKPIGEWLWENFLKPIADWTGGVIVSVLEGIGNALEWISKHDTARAVLEGVAITIGAVSTAIGVYKTVTTTATAISDGFKIALAGINPTAAIITAALSLLVAGGIALYKNWDTVKEFASKTWTSIKTTIVNSIDGAKKGIYSAMTAIKNTWNVIWSSISTTTSNIWDGIVGFIKNSINWILGGIEGMANGIVKGINVVINALNKLNISAPQWVTDLTGITSFGFDIPNLSEITLPRFATGGFPEDGLFFANHNELVGSFSNGKTAVANNAQIVEGIEAGVYRAVTNAMRNGNTTVVLEGDAKGLFKVVRKEANDYFDRNGESAFSY